MPAVSIAMPVFNAAGTLPAAIRSVQAQTLRDWELWIVDDGSTDHSTDIARSFAAEDARIQVLTTGFPSGGPASPRNLALSHSRGMFQAFLDADDLWFPDKLLAQVRFMEARSADFSCTGYGAFYSGAKQPFGYLIPPAEVGYRQLMAANTAGCLTVMYRRSVFPEARFPVCGHEDYALWLSFLRSGQRLAGCPEVLAAYRVSRSSVSSSPWRNLRYFWNIYRRQEGLGLIAAAWSCGRYAWKSRRKYRPVSGPSVPVAAGGGLSE